MLLTKSPIVLLEFMYCMVYNVDVMKEIEVGNFKPKYVTAAETA
jgi:hypothetical protein